jgi:hypothetical protein
MTDDRQIVQFFKGNMPYLLGVLFLILNLYLTSLILPLKNSIDVLATNDDRLETQQQEFSRNGSVSAQITAEKVAIIQSDMNDLKLSIRELNNKLDRLIER